MKNYFVAKGSLIEDGAEIGDGTKIWFFCHIRKGAKIGKNCNIGNGCYIDTGVILGNDVRVGNNVSLYKGFIAKDRVFIGNSATFTNVRKPRVDKKQKLYLDTIVSEDVYIGANATIVAGVRIGQGSIITEGSVVVRNIYPDSFVLGNPGKIIKKASEME